MTNGNEAGTVAVLPERWLGVPRLGALGWDSHRGARYTKSPCRLTPSSCCDSKSWDIDPECREAGCRPTASWPRRAPRGPSPLTRLGGRRPIDARAGATNGDSSLRESPARTTTYDRTIAGRGRVPLARNNVASGNWTPWRPTRNGPSRVTEAAKWRIDSTCPKTPESSCGSTSLAVRFQCGGADQNHCPAGVLSRHGKVTGNWWPRG